MPSVIGKQAVVIGAGMAGLAAARSLADFFDHVIVLESDVLPPEATPRPGTPQAKHAHALLASGLRALASLFPDIEQSLTSGGAVSLRMSSDVRMEQPGYDPFPQRDLGIRVFSLTRPLLELVVRKRLQEFSNIAFFESCRAREFTSVANGSAVTAVQCEYLDGRRVALPADFVVDATGHGGLTMAFLKSAQCPLPEETLIGVDISYATVILDAPGDPPSDWKAIITFPDPPQNRRAAVILPVEGNRWLLTLGGRFETKPPNDWDGSLEYLRNMRTPTIHEAVRSVGRPSELARFGFKQSRWRHFEHLESFPLALLPFGDAICRFNPIYGQGMSVAALEAQLLRKLLMAHSANRDEIGFANLASTFFAEAATIIETPWMSAAVPDFIDPLTEGERPADLKDTLKFTAGLMKLAARDPAIHRLFIEVQQLLKPRSAYRDPELVGRVRAVMAEQEVASNRGSQ